MKKQATDKLIESIAQLFEAYSELREKIQEEYDVEENEDEEDEEISEASIEMEAAIVNELRAAIESVMDTEDVPAEDLALLLSTMSDALEEIAPDVFASEEGEEEEEDEDLEDLDEDEVDEDFDYDDEDEELEDLDDEDEEEDYEEEEEDDD